MKSMMVANNRDLNLGVGYIDLQQMQKDRIYYVDQTKIIEDLLNQNVVVSLITRPRRFGKTLSMNILKHFFALDPTNPIGTPTKTKNLFKNFYISKNKKLCKEHMGKYPVISLSFSRIEGEHFNDLEELMKSIFIELYRQYSYVLLDQDRLIRNYMSIDATKMQECTEDRNFSIEQVKEDFRRFTNKSTEIDDYRNALRILIEVVYFYYLKPVVLLIDEYDVPLLKGLTYGYYDQILRFMKPIIGVVKDNPYIYKSVLTGCLRIAQESFFTGANNFHHYGVDQIPFSDDIGFSKEQTLELLKYYQLEDNLDEVIDWYDGYLFGNTSMVCPWNIIQYCKDKLDDPKTKATSYWINSSENAILNTVLNNLSPSIVDVLQSLVDQQAVLVTINDHLVLNKIKNYALNPEGFTVKDSPLYSEQAFWTILYHSGYITSTQKATELNIKKDQRLVKIPNREILEIFKDQIIDRFSNNNPIHKQNAFQILELFAQEPSPEHSFRVEECLQNLLQNFISIRDGAKGEFKSHPEWYYHAFLNGLFSGIFSLPQYSDHFYASNKELGNGYADISFKIPYAINPNERIGVIIELKAVDEPRLDQNYNLILDQALEQISKKQYVEGMMNNRALYRVNIIYQYAIVFCKKNCYVKAKKINKDQLQ